MLCFQLILFDKILLHFFVKTTGISWWVTGAVEFFEPSFNSPWIKIFHGNVIQGYSWQDFIIIKTSDQTLGITSIYDATIFCCQLGGIRSSKDELIVNICGELVMVYASLCYNKKWWYEKHTNALRRDIVFSVNHYLN